MFQSPQSLEELCLNEIAENIKLYTKEVYKTNLWCDYLELIEKPDPKYVFRDPDIFLIQRISERLMFKLVEKGLLHDAVINIFSEQNTKLGSVRLANCHVTEDGLRILKNHNIVHLECVDLKSVSIGEVIDCLSSWSQSKMMTASFPKCTFVDKLKVESYMQILNLKNLRSLNLAYTELDQSCFTKICSSLIHLENLNISGTLVKNLFPLQKLSSQLKSLGLADLPHLEELIPMLLEMDNLETLDMSIVNEKIDNEVEVLEASKILNYDKALPKLRSLEISGWRKYTPGSTLYSFLKAHPKLEYLGIVLSDLMFEPIFSDPSYSSYPSHLTIGGLGNKEQIKVTLQKYKDRSIYVQRALYHLFQITNGSYPEISPTMFDLVLPVMATHSMKFSVQMAATACLYNLTKGDFSKHIHPNLLSRGINLTLDAMSCFPREYQLQKNSLLTLCNDRILQEVNFDRFRCARLVLDALCAFCDNNISRMAVAICSILAAKISTAETSKLGAKHAYMRKLLDMVENRVENVISDITLKFTLSALWNLTDESPATCSVFLSNQGATLFLNVLKTFKDDSTIETKVLGLLNNIAEVSELRQSLMLDLLIEELHSLLRSENIEVSYFAAGIVAHLASEGGECWVVESRSREDMLNELGCAIMQWQVPQSEMVSYRSFKPFFPLLAVGMDYRVQLWALWAIHHVCTKIPKRYCAMLREEGGDILLNKLIDSPYSNSEIKKISGQIMDTLKSN